MGNVLTNVNSNFLRAQIESPHQLTISMYHLAKGLYRLATSKEGQLTFLPISKQIRSPVSS